MTGVTLCGRSFLIGGALILPYMRRLERILKAKRQVADTMRLSYERSTGKRLPGRQGRQ